MSRNPKGRLRDFVAAGFFGLLAVAAMSSGRGQTLPIAGNPQEAAAQDLAQRRAAGEGDGIRGVREQDNAAVRTANQLNRDTREEARQQLQAGIATRAQSADIRRDQQGDLRDVSAMNSGLRGADLGLWFSSRPGANGLIVADVASQGAFARAGLRENDRIVSVNGQAVASEAQFVQTLLAPGTASQPASIVIDRNGQQQAVSIQPSAISQNIASFDPLYQTGLLVDERGPGQLTVQRVFPRTPAFYAGLRPGDVLTSINGLPITSSASLMQALQAGTASNIVVSRNGQARQLSLAAIGDGSLRTALRPGVGNHQSGSNTVNQVDQSGLSTAGRVNSGGAVGTTVPGQTSSALAPSAINTSPGVNPAAVIAGQTTPTGPGVAGVGATGGPNPFSGGPISSAGVSPANPAVPAFGSASATGSTSVLGGAGATAGGAGAVGGTGALGGAGSSAGGAGAVGGTGALGGAGSTAGPSGGSPSGTSAPGGAGSGTGGSAAGGGSGGGAGGGGAGAGGT